MKHQDKNGVELAVGDTVRYGASEGTVLILEDWKAAGFHSREAGCYVSSIGYWGDCKAVPASSLVKVGA
jgi:hypothetical protein